MILSWTNRNELIRRGINLSKEKDIRRLLRIRRRRNFNIEKEVVFNWPKLLGYRLAVVLFNTVLNFDC
jgi:hypothetical protein